MVVSRRFVRVWSDRSLCKCRLDNRLGACAESVSAVERLSDGLVRMGGVAYQEKRTAENPAREKRNGGFNARAALWFGRRSRPRVSAGSRPCNDPAMELTEP